MLEAMRFKQWQTSADKDRAIHVIELLARLYPVECLDLI